MLLTNQHQEEIKKKAVFIKKQQIKDTYYDTEEYFLTLSNKWLRKREKRFELKIGPKSNQSFDHFQEIDDEYKIRKILDLDPSLPLENSLFKIRIIPFCSFITTREKYKWDKFTIDIDIADFKDFSYQLAEFELLVSKKEEMPLAQKKIESKIEELKINSKEPILAKLSYFLRIKRPDHYQKLVDAKVIKI